MVSTINLYHGRINNWLRCSLGHKPPMAVFYTFLGILPILLMKMIILPCLFRTVTWHFSEHPINLLKKKKEQSDSQHDSCTRALELQVYTRGNVLCQASSSSWSQEAVPRALHPIKSFGGKWEEGALSKSLTSQFSGGQDYSKGENQSGCFSASTSLLEKDHTE